MKESEKIANIKSLWVIGHELIKFVPFQEGQEDAGGRFLQPAALDAGARAEAVDGADGGAQGGDSIIF